MTQYVFAVANGPSSPDTASIMDSSTKLRPSLTRPRRTNAVPLPANAPATRSRVSGQPTDPQHFVVQRDRCRRVAVEVESPYRLQLDQSSQLRAGFAALEQPLGASRPTQGDRDAVAHAMGHDQIDGQARGAAFLGTGDAISERVLAELDAGVPLADPHGGRRATLEVIQIERGL